MVFLIFLLSVSRLCAQLDHGQGEMSGEVTQTSAIIQSRLTKGSELLNGDLPGQAGWAQFEVSRHSDMSAALSTGWREVFTEDDHIVKAQLDLLEPGTQYYFRLVFGPDPQKVTYGKTCSFRTLPKSDKPTTVRFAVISEMNYHAFHDGPNAYRGDDKDRGYPALESIRKFEPDFVVAAGNSVFYDHPSKSVAQTVKSMRQRWHVQFSQPRFRDLFDHVPFYWQKNDHDYRYDDADASGDRLPSHKDGMAVFKEQVPVVNPFRKEGPTYRTFRIGKYVQIWLTESRDYRSPNTAADGPEKTMWGETQRAWLERTLSANDATFKFLISPTPLIGPDSILKRDNQSNVEGFAFEGDGFISWLYGKGFYDKNFFILCGDMPWQYYSIHPTGFEEFSCGTLVDANAQKGISPGDPGSTDPNRLISQRYTSAVPSGGFLTVEVTPNADIVAALVFRDEKGIELYRVEKSADK
ncbi:MAG: alkaline phosphatase D family protein [bacterium]|nr:alkaline phosphatase D family protein [bacterium]